MLPSSSHSSGARLLVVIALMLAAGPADDRMHGAELLPVISLPQNVVGTDAVRRRIAALLQRSPTLRPPVRTDRAAPQMQIDIRLNLHAHPSVDTARTTFRRYRSGAVLAELEVPGGIFFAELLAHEFEHVLEQIEGADELSSPGAVSPGPRAPSGAS